MLIIIAFRLARRIHRSDCNVKTIPDPRKILLLIKTFRVSIAARTANLIQLTGAGQANKSQMGNFPNLHRVSCINSTSDR